MTPREKIAVSIPADLAGRAREAVKKGRAASVSAYVTAALEERVKLDDLDDLLGEMLAETGGPMTDEERAWADGVLDR
jgi:Arc/MetJ-type ribon-helix-helix transcriptional regulator